MKLARTAFFASALALAALLSFVFPLALWEGNGRLEEATALDKVPQPEPTYSTFLPSVLNIAAPAPTPTATPTQVASCGSESAFLIFSPLALANVDAIVPLGNFNPTGHVFPTDHIYWYIKKTDPNDPQSAPVEVPLYSPSNAWITGISASDHLSATPPFTDYSLVMSSCKEFEFRFGHVTSLSQRLREKLVPPFDSCSEYATGGQQYRYCSKSFQETELGVEAGEIVGTAGGRSGQNALDVWAWDFRTPSLPYANPGRWSNQSLHVVCPLDYFAANVKNPILAKVQRTTPPVCGEAEQDEPGTAQGAWFLKGTTQTYPEDPHIALAHDNINPAIAVFSVGTSTANSGLPSGVYPFNPTGSGRVNRDFKEVTADGGIYCYEPLSYSGSGQPSTRTILLQLTSPTELRVQGQAAALCGGGPWSFGTVFTDFER